MNQSKRFDFWRPAGPLVLLALAGLGFFTAWINEPPRAAGPDAPATAFSAARAMTCLRVIAERPHPVASADQERVRAYLVKRLGELGANPSVETANAAGAGRSGPRTFAVVHNIVARIPGTASTGAVMLVAHYDSVPSGPGAADDGASVAAILETLRAIKSGPPLRNDVIVLFTDAEELGMVGARAFVENYPDFRDIRIVLNFEMRGDYGPSMMFQTSAANEWLIHALGAAPYPRATSLAPEAYKRMPNDTDLTVFMSAGLAGMNFAAIGGLQRYHTRLDDIAHLDANTLQHQGGYALAMARRFGAMNLAAAHPVQDDVYFNVGSALPHYPDFLALPLAIIAVLLTFGVLTAATRWGRITLEGAAAGLAVFAVSLAVAIGAALLADEIVRTLALRFVLPSGTTYGASWFAAASLTLVFAALWAYYALAIRFVATIHLGAGALAAWAILAMGCASALAGASYLFVWPLIAAALAFHLGFSGKGQPSRLRIGAALCLAVAPAVVLAAPIMHLTSDGIPLVLMVAAFIAAMILGLALPYLDWIRAGTRWIAPGALAIVAAILFGLGLHASPFSAAQPRPDTIFYLLDSDTGKASWESLDRAPDRWTAQFFQHHVRLGSLATATGMTASVPSDPRTARYDPRQLFSRVGGGLTIVGDAPAVPLAPPVLTVTSDTQSGSARTLRMHIVSPRHAPIVWVAVPYGIDVTASSADGVSARGRASSGYTAWFWNVPAAGFDLSLKIAHPGAFRVTVIDETFGLPASAMTAMRPRPVDVMPSPFVFFDSATLVRKDFVVGHGKGWGEVLRGAAREPRALVRAEFSAMVRAAD